MLYGRISSCSGKREWYTGCFHSWFWENRTARACVLVKIGLIQCIMLFHMPSNTSVLRSDLSLSFKDFFSTCALFFIRLSLSFKLCCMWILEGETERLKLMQQSKGIPWTEPWWVVSSSDQEKRNLIQQSLVMLGESNELVPDHHALHTGTEEDGLRTAILLLQQQGKCWILCMVPKRIQLRYGLVSGEKKQGWRTSESPGKEGRLRCP